MYNKEVIKENLSTNPKWIERGVVVLYQRQTEDEKRSGNTIVDNKMGFNGSDSRYLSYCARFIFVLLNQKNKYEKFIYVFDLCVINHFRILGIVHLGYTRR